MPSYSSNSHFVTSITTHHHYLGKSTDSDLHRNVEEKGPGQRQGQRQGQGQGGPRVMGPIQQVRGLGWVRVICRCMYDKMFIHIVQQGPGRGGEGVGPVLSWTDGKGRESSQLRSYSTGILYCMYVHTQSRESFQFKKLINAGIIDMIAYIEQYIYLYMYVRKISQFEEDNHS